MLACLPLISSCPRQVSSKKGGGVREERDRDSDGSSETLDAGRAYSSIAFGVFPLEASCDRCVA